MKRLWIATASAIFVGALLWLAAIVVYDLMHPETWRGCRNPHVYLPLLTVLVVVESWLILHAWLAQRRYLQSPPKGAVHEPPA